MSTNSQTRPTPPLVFLDTETVGLDPFLHDAWEIAAIVRTDGADEEHVYRIQPDLTNADPKALEINRYHERTSADGWEWDDRRTAASRLYALLNGAVLVGSNPAFDAEMLVHLFGRYYADPRPWHYRTVDVATLAAGYRYGQIGTVIQLGGRHIEGDDVPVPYSSYGLSTWMGVDPPAADLAHTALGDARWVRDVYDKVTGPQDVERAA